MNVAECSTNVAKLLLHSQKLKQLKINTLFPFLLNVANVASVANMLKTYWRLYIIIILKYITFVYVATFATFATFDLKYLSLIIYNFFQLATFMLHSCYIHATFDKIGVFE